MGYTESRKISTDLKGCILKVRSTGEELFSFDATTFEEKSKRGSFIGSGIAADNQSFRILTTKVYNYELLNHVVVIDGVDYMIVARQPATKISVGERYGKKKNQGMILTLE